MQEILIEVAKKYGLFVVGGAIGAVIHRLRKNMSFGRFLISIVISMFVALCVGVVARDYFNLQISVVNVLCGISGVFSEVILEEIEETIKQVSQIVKNKFGKDDSYSDTEFDEFKKKD